MEVLAHVRSIPNSCSTAYSSRKLRLSRHWHLDRYQFADFPTLTKSRKYLFPGLCLSDRSCDRHQRVHVHKHVHNTCAIVQKYIFANTCAICSKIHLCKYVYARIYTYMQKCRSITSPKYKHVYLNKPITYALITNNKSHRLFCVFFFF